MIHFQIDIAVIREMDDKDLAQFIPLYGDRIALRSFLKKEDEKRRKKSKVTLVASLRQKLKNMRRPKKLNSKDKMFEKDESDSDLESPENAANPYKGNQNATKETRKIKFGLKSKVDDSFLNVRVKKGGGPRDMSVKKSWKKKELIESAKELYFGMQGTSKLGCVNDFDFDMQNYEEEILPDDITVKTLYEKTGLSKLTFYLLLIPKNQELPKIQRPPKRPRITESNTLNDDTCSNEDYLPDPSLPNSIYDHSEVVCVDILSEALKAADVPMYFQLDNNNSVDIDASSDMSTVLTSDISTLFPSSLCTNTPSGISTGPPLGTNTGPPLGTNTDPPSCIRTPGTATGPPSGTDTDPLSGTGTGPSSGISTNPPSDTEADPPSGTSTGSPSGSNTVYHEEFTSIDSLLPVVSNTVSGPYPENIASAADTDKVLRVHRGTLLDEMIVFFKDSEIMDKHISFEFVNERGSDMNGVSRDAYSAFWIEFFRRSSEGEESRVPALNSKWKGEEWQAIGKIFAKGFKDQNVFPVQMSPVTSIVLSFGEASITKKILNDAFLNYISQTERDTLVSSLKKENFDGELFDDLLDFLDRFSCTQKPTPENLETLINNIAHKELIQRPKYATDNMAIGCQDFMLSHFISVEKILITYQDMEPTPRKVLKMITATPNGNAEATSLRYFQQYVRGQNSTSLKKLLRFLTGSEAVTVDKIEVTFTKLEGFGRRPVAHTCGPLLELPSTYLSYPELRNEFDSILANESCFVMNRA